MAVQVELLGGPFDGHLIEVPDDTELWVLVQPPMTAEEFVRMQDAPSLVDFANRKPREHAYVPAERRSVTSGAWLFRYMGERVSQ